MAMQQIARTGSARLRLGALVLGCAVAVLSACGSDPDPGTTADTSSATSTTPTTLSTEVTDESLTTMVVAMSGSAQADLSEKQSDCMVRSVRESDLSEAALYYMITAPKQDKGSLVAGLREHVAPDQAQILLSRDLQSALDECAGVRPVPPVATASKSTSTKGDKTKNDADDKTKDKKKADASSTPKGKKKTSSAKATKDTKISEPGADAEPNFQPKYTVSERENIITASQLEPGLLSMFSSYAIDDTQKKLYASASNCMAKAVLKADLSQESLRFIAGGAPIATGSIADHLPVAADRKAWNTGSLTSDLSQCISAAASSTP